MRIHHKQFLCAIKRHFIHDRHNDIVVDFASILAFADILLIAKHIGNAPERKDIALMGANTAFFKPRFYFFNRRAVYIIVEHLSYYLGFVRNNLVFLVHDAITKYRLYPCRITFQTALTHTALNLLRKFGRVVFRHALNHRFKYNALGRIGNLFASRQNLYAVLFERRFIDCAIVPISRKSIELIYKYVIKFLLRAVFQHLLKLFAFVRLTRNRSVDILMCNDISIAFGKFVANAKLSLNALLGLLLATVPSINYSFLFSYFHNHSPFVLLYRDCQVDSRQDFVRTLL